MVGSQDSPVRLASVPARANVRSEGLPIPRFDNPYRSSNNNNTTTASRRQESSTGTSPTRSLNGNAPTHQYNVAGTSRSAMESCSPRNDSGNNKRLKTTHDNGTSDVVRHSATRSDTTTTAVSISSVTSRSDDHLRTPMSTDSRRVNCEIHSSIDLCPITCWLLDTPYLQRLRALKQLGTAEYVYPSTNHTRLEHSMGVAHLAQRLLTRIAQRQPLLGVTPVDITCVKLAGLLHDVGHGPFSHVFEKFCEYHHKQQLAERKVGDPVPPEPVKHETISLKLIDAMLAYYGLEIDLEHLDEPLKHIGSQGGTIASSICVFGREGDSATSTVLTSRDFVFIKECIEGKPLKDIEKVLGKGFHGRPTRVTATTALPNKEWLYDIVCNHRSGLDVDKVDYFARDERRAMRAAGEIDKVMIEEAVVCWAPCTDPVACYSCQQLSGQRLRGRERSHVNEHLMICYPEKMVVSAIAFFRKRFELHSKVYRHKTVEAVQFMICDALCAADKSPNFLRPVLSSLTKNCSVGAGKRDYDRLPLSRAAEDPAVYVGLRDTILDDILTTIPPKTNDKNLEQAQRIIERLNQREMYKCAAQKRIDMSEKISRKIWKMKTDEMALEMVELRGEHKDENGRPLKLCKDDFVLDKCGIHYGSKDRNPIDNMRFLERSKVIQLQACDSLDSLPVATAVNSEEYSSHLPRSFQENSLRVFARDSSKTGLVSHVFYAWFEWRSTELQMTGMQEDAEEGQNNDGPRMMSQDSDTEFPYDMNDSDDDDDEEERVQRRRSSSSFGLVARLSPKAGDASAITPPRRY